MNTPKLPEVADVEESLFELEAAVFDYEQTFLEFTRGEKSGADMEKSRENLRESGRILREARARLEEVTREFADLDALVGGEHDLAKLRASLGELGFGGDDFGLR